LNLRLGDILTYAAAILLGALFLMPLAWLLSLALRTPQEVYLGAARFIPEDPTLENFAKVLSDGAFASYLWNGVKLSASGAAIAILAATPAAYALSRRTIRFAQPFLLGILALQMISPLVLLLPLYRYMDRLGLLDSHLGVILVYAALGLPLSVWLLKTGFDAIPRALEEAAQIDGAGPLATLWEISLPLALPSLASAFILNMIAGWSQFLVPFILLTRDSQLPVSVAIFNYAGSTSASTTQLLAAACLLAVLPALLAFLAVQRLILRAIMAGAVKG
jgi:multiple sugar transport system permease protein